MLFLLTEIIAFSVILLYLSRGSNILNAIVQSFLIFVVKAIFIGIILGFFYRFDVSTIALVGTSFNIGIIVFGFIYRRSLYQSYEEIAQKVVVHYNSYGITAFLLLLVSVCIFNTIPFGGDELMYHLPISLELLQKGSWMEDLGLSYYWYNNIWQWYPKNTYFIIDYFFVLSGGTMVGIQLYSIFVLLFFFFTTVFFIDFLMKKYEVKDFSYTLLVSFLVLSLPVIFLQLFVKGDILITTLLLLFLHSLWSEKPLVFSFLLALLICGFKLLGPYLVVVIMGAYMLYQLLCNRTRIGAIIGEISIAWKSLVIVTMIAPFFLYSYLYNAAHIGHFLYPGNIIHTSSLDPIIPSFFGLQTFFRDFIFSDFYSYGNLEQGIFSVPQTFFYNYDRGLGILGICILGGLIVAFITRKFRFLSYHTFFLLAVFLLLSFSKIYLIFHHRYIMVFYVPMISLFALLVYKHFSRVIAYSILVLYIIASFISSYASIGAFVNSRSGLEQLKHMTTSDYCDKISYLGDISRHDFRSTWKYICNTSKTPSNILAVHQVFNFYLYGQSFQNKIWNKLFMNKDEFLQFLSTHNIDLILTTNKNNFYAKYGIRDNTFFTTTHSSSDESIMFCVATEYENITRISVDSRISQPKDMIVNLGVNYYSSNRILSGGPESLEIPKTQVKNICITMFHLPRESFDSGEKSLQIDGLILEDDSGKIYNLSATDFHFMKKSIEEIWLSGESSYQQIHRDNFHDLDIVTLWKKK